MQVFGSDVVHALVARILRLRYLVLARTLDTRHGLQHGVDAVSLRGDIEAGLRVFPRGWNKSGQMRKAEVRRHGWFIATVKAYCLLRLPLGQAYLEEIYLALYDEFNV
ncbi:uncharacterized protein MYCFIDRAFT_80424 [Pseudocercospora fijiensis CIRAD86]|uniref:Uncharacterized protein n=1 Tax=Pseudocercospora fijiensis (strain CIRAD86) TaxID=383855 RepID=M2YYW7_PSEFD|nr:uncharacterized protein MYCFIDRAFT_80424 [Pseudocercospora fijiensis CIRAD86]EME82825.1 hypothetical protein MYCFIDRAFT_80424 [Pseudocercospora fijiensis CIRAD86]